MQLREYGPNPIVPITKRIVRRTFKVKTTTRSACAVVLRSGVLELFSVMLEFTEMFSKEFEEEGVCFKGLGTIRMNADKNVTSRARKTKEAM